MMKYVEISSPMVSSDISIYEDKTLIVRNIEREMIGEESSLWDCAIKFVIVASEQKGRMRILCFMGEE